jgi:hypothetical protein
MAMRTRHLYLASGLCMIAVRSGITQTEPEIARDNLSIHTVQRGNMPLRLMADGEIVSLKPSQALVTVRADASSPCLKSL